MKLTTMGVVLAVLALVPVVGLSQQPATSDQPAGGCCKAKAVEAAQTQASCGKCVKAAVCVEKMKEADARLQAKVDAMKAAQGEQKVAAMQAVIEELAAQNKALREMIVSCCCRNGKCAVAEAGACGKAACKCATECKCGAGDKTACKCEGACGCAKPAACKCAKECKCGAGDKTACKCEAACKCAKPAAAAEKAGCCAKAVASS